MSALSDRLRTIVKAGPQPAIPAAPAIPAHPALDAALGARWDPAAACFTVERRWESSAPYGRQTIGELSARWQDAVCEAPLLAAGATRGPFVFFDLETTGLSGGAGTYAFLVGCGWFDDGGFVTRQYLLTRISDERPLLLAVAGALGAAGALVSFNGKSFDAPVLETRYLFHRLEWPGARLPHVDLLHPARRFWGAPRESSSDCSLIALERSVLGASRVGDIAGFEIPSRFFHFLRCGDPLPLEPVLHHNRLDLLSLAALSTRLLHLLKRGPSSTSDPAEAYAVGRTYARSGLDARAIEAFRCAACLRPSPALKIDVLRSLALMLRRMRRFDEAADIWCQTIALPGCPGHIAREASQALAVHHEHRVRDLAAAKAFALGTLDDRRPAWDRAARHRLSRLEKKIERTANASQPSLPSSS